MARSSRHAALACPMCGYNVSFILCKAVISSELWVQRSAQRFRRESRAPKRFDFVVPLLMSCAQCGQPVKVPDALRR